MPEKMSLEDALAVKNAVVTLNSINIKYGKPQGLNPWGIVDIAKQVLNEYDAAIKAAVNKEEHV